MQDPKNFLKQAYQFIFLVCQYTIVLVFLIIVLLMFSYDCNPVDLYNGIPSQQQSSMDIQVKSWLGDMGFYSIDVPTRQLNEYMVNNHDTWISYYQVGSQYEAICEQFSMVREGETVTILFRGYSVMEPDDRVHMRWDFECPESIWFRLIQQLPQKIENSNILITIR